MLTINQYSDAGEVSLTTSSSWEAERSRRAEYRSYFDGSIFSSTVVVESENGEEEIEEYPIGINLAKMICEAQADMLWGEWEESIVTFEPRQDAQVLQPEKDAIEIAKNILVASNANEILWELGLHREIYGGSGLKISPQLKGPAYIRWSLIPPDGFLPVWDPEDINELLEVYVISEITQEQARLKYGVKTTKDPVPLLEHWTRKTYEFKVDSKRIEAFSGVNPWGFVPFVYIPRIRTHLWWGDSLIEDVKRIQDELNARVADLSDSINYNTHPIKWGINITKGFSPKNFPVGPNVMWDLGKAVGDSPEPKVGVLEANDPVPDGSFEYINFLYDLARTSTFSPPIAFGDDSGGGQRSGITLEIRLLPLIRATRRSRAYLSDGLSRAMKYSALILQQKKIPDMSIKALDRLVECQVVPKFAPLLPRDTASLVDMVVKLIGTNPPSISLDTAVKILGLGTSEVARIKDMIADEDLEIIPDISDANDVSDASDAGDTPGSNSGTGLAPDKDSDE